MSRYKCPDCGANLDAGEKCDCKEEKKKGTPPKGESAKEKNKTM